MRNLPTLCIMALYMATLERVRDFLHDPRQGAIDLATHVLEPRMEFEQLPQSLQALVPNELYGSVVEIPYEKWVDEGVDTVLFDLDGCLRPIDLWEIDPETQESIAQARAAGIKNIGIVTNKKPRDEIDRMKMIWAAHEIGADKVFFPDEKGDRKPNPYLPLEAVAYFGTTTTKTRGVGDKATADTAAYNRSGVINALVTKKTDLEDDRDYIGDKFLRDPVERMWRHYMEHLDRTEGLPQAPEPSAAGEKVGELQNKFSLWKDTVRPEGEPRRWDQILIGDEGGDKEFREFFEAEIDSLIPLSYTGVAQDFQQFIRSPGFEKVSAVLVEHFSKHGRPEADMMTLSRILFTPLQMGLIMKKKYAAALGVGILMVISDKESPVARHDSRKKSGITKAISKIMNKDIDGPIVDPWADKINSIGASAALARQQPWLWPFVIAKTAREINHTGKYFEAKHDGKEPRALWSGKATTVFDLAVIVLSTAVLASGKKLDKKMIVTWATLAAAKWASAMHERKGWETLHKWRESDKVKMAEVKAILEEAPLTVPV